MADTTFRDAFLIGLAQSLAPLPGVSRSGITVSSAIIRGLNPAWAAIFSLWISLPTIAGALLMETRDIMESPETESLLIKLSLAGACVSGIVGYGAIIWLVKAVKSRKLNLFAAYLTVLGFAVLVWSQLRGQ